MQLFGLKEPEEIEAEDERRVREELYGRNPDSRVEVIEPDEEEADGSER